MANPAFNAKTFEQVRAQTGEAMTVEGTVNKTALLLFLVMVPAAWVWSRTLAAVDPAVAAMPYLLVGALGGLLFAVVTIFKKEWAPVTAPIYALLEGLALGAISAFYQLQFKGIVFQAVGLTFAVLAVMLMLYRTGVIKVTDKFRFMVVAATVAVGVVYLVTIVLSLFGITVPFIHQSGTFGIVFSLVVVGIASLNLALDFDLIARGSEGGAPKFMEWYAAFGLMVTLIWLYLEILRLLSKLRRR